MKRQAKYFVTHYKDGNDIERWQAMSKDGSPLSVAFSKEDGGLDRAASVIRAIIGSDDVVVKSMIATATTEPQSIHESANGSAVVEEDIAEPNPIPTLAAEELSNEETPRLTARDAGLVRGETSEVEIQTNIGAIADRNNPRWALGGALIDPVHMVACATDGRGLVILPVECKTVAEDAKPVVVPSTLLKPKGKKPLQLALNGRATRTIPGQPAITDDYIVGRFPRVRDVTKMDNAVKTTVRICLDAKLLHDIATALHTFGSETLSVDIEVPVKVQRCDEEYQECTDGQYIVHATADPICVAALAGVGYYPPAGGGIIMPMTNDGNRTSPRDRVRELGNVIDTDIDR